jgi:WD40 repeat protein
MGTPVFPAKAVGDRLRAASPVQAKPPTSQTNSQNGNKNAALATPVKVVSQDAIVASPGSRKPRRKAEWHSIQQFETTSRIYAIALSPTEPILVSSTGNVLKLWDLEKGQPLRTLTGHLDIVPAIALSPNGKLLVSGSADKLVVLWELPTGRKLANLSLHSDTVLALALSPTEQLLASSSFYDPICLYDLANRQKRYTLTGHTARVDAIAFSPDGTLLASGGGDLAIKLWDVQTGKELRTLESHAYPISALVFSPDGTTLASGSWDGTVKLWNLKTRRHRTLELDCGRVNHLAWSTDGKKLAIAADTLQLWTLSSGKKLHLPATSEPAISLIFGQSDQTLISASGDRIIQVWQLS